MPAVSHGLLVGFATLCAYRFRFPSKQNARLVPLLQRSCLYLGGSSICCASAEPNHGWPRIKTAANAFHLWVGCRWWHLLWRHNYRAPPSVRLLFACCQSPSAWLAHLTHCGSFADNFCVFIIRNCCPNYWKRKNNSISAQNHVWIIREVELFERIWYLD